MTGWKNRSCPPRRRSSETAVVGHRNWGHQWALWRRSGEDRRITRTETREGVLCERWDSRRGSIRHANFTWYTGRESIRERQGKAVRTEYYGTIVILFSLSHLKEVSADTLE